MFPKSVLAHNCTSCQESILLFSPHHLTLLTIVLYIHMFLKNSEQGLELKRKVIMLILAMPTFSTCLLTETPLKTVTDACYLAHRHSFHFDKQKRWANNSVFKYKDKMGIFELWEYFHSEYYSYSYLDDFSIQNTILFVLAWFPNLCSICICIRWDF